jgi:hypothetical protein
LAQKKKIINGKMLGGGLATPKGKTEKTKIWRVWSLGVAEPPPWAKTDLDFFFVKGWLNHPMGGVSAAPDWPRGCVFIFSILFF